MGIKLVCLRRQKESSHIRAFAPADESMVITKDPTLPLDFSLPWRIHMEKHILKGLHYYIHWLLWMHTHVFKLQSSLCKGEHGALAFNIFNKR